jgi:hypothetical protein
MHDPYPWFTKPCLRVFGRLSSELGFSSPSVEQLGQERYVRFEKRAHVVSIVYEPGQVPLIELFYPTHAVANRRIPRLQVPDVAALHAFNAQYHKLCRRRQFQEADRLLEDHSPALESALEQYLVSQFGLLQEQERDFLNGSALR